MDYKRRSRSTPARSAAPTYSSRGSGYNNSAGPSGPRKLPVVALVLIDLAGAAIIFGALYYSFIRPQALNVVPEDLPKASATAHVVKPSASTHATAQTSAAAEQSATVEQSAAPESTPDADQGQFGAKFADKFSNDDGHYTDNGYQSRNINVTINKMQKTNDDNTALTYYVADVYVRNVENLRTAFAKNTYGNGITEHTPDMAKDNHAIVAISGDYYGYQSIGPVVRNGKLYRDSNRDADVCVLSNDGTMTTYASGQFNIEDVKKNGAWQVWCFGPRLLDDNGQPLTSFTGETANLGGKNPRSSVGYFEPGHYAFVLVDGRQEGYSEGITLKGLSKLYADLGCKAAYNLDGGASAEMAFQDKLISQPTKGGRNVSDIIYFAETQK